MLSLYQIDFITPAGVWRLLNVGEEIAAEISPKVSQRAATYAAIGAAWGASVAEGGALVTLDWQTIRPHASHAALRGHCLSHPASLPYGRSGTLRLYISGGDFWDITDATLLSCAPTPLLPSDGFESLTAYSVTGGKIQPAAPLALYPGIPWPWLLQDWDTLTPDWTTL